MNELPLQDYAAAHHRLLLPVLSRDGVPVPGALGLIHFESDQEISDTMIELSVLFEATVKTALFTFSADQQALILIPFDEAKRLRLLEDVEYMGRQAFHYQQVTYHMGVLFSISA